MSELGRLLEGKEQLFLLDLSWHLHRSYNALKFMEVDIDGYKRPTGHIYGILDTIKTIKTEYPKSVIILCQDGIPVERQALLGSEGYKEGRPELGFDFYKDINIVKACACVIPGVVWAYNEDKESDDLMYALAKQAVKVFDGKVFIYSGDNDLLQAIEDRIVIIRHKGTSGFVEITNETVQTEKNFLDKFRGVDVEHIVNYRAICGDSSDHVRGIDRFPRKLAVKIAQATECIKDGHNYKPQTATEERYCKVLADNIDIVRRNYDVMKLSEDFEVKISKPKVKKDKLAEIIESLQLKSFNKYLLELSVIEE